MHQGGALECLTRLLPGKPLLRHPMQFGVNLFKQPLLRARFAAVGSFEKLRHFVHDRRYYSTVAAFQAHLPAPRPVKND
jgi:hypothetical protein